VGKIPDLKRVTVEDFKSEDRDLVGKLAFIINSFHEQVRSALSKNIDFDNLNQEVISLSFSTGSSGQPLNAVKFKSSLATRVQGISVVRTVIISSNTELASVLPIISWSQNVNLITISNIGGLSPETKYELTLLTI